MARQIVVDIIGDSTKFSKSTDDAVKATVSFESRLDRVKKSLTSGFGMGIGASVMGMATNAIHDVVGALGDAVNAAIEDEQATARLTQTIKANVSAWDGNLDAVNAAIDAGAKLAFTDDDVREGLNALIPRTKDIAEANRLNALAMDLARAKNMGLGEAATLVGKAYSGQVSALKRAGISIKNTKDSTAALAELQQVVGGQAEAYANTTQGAMQRMDIAISEALESIGYALLPVAQALATFAADLIPEVITRLGDLGKSFNDLHRTIDPNLAALQDLEKQIRLQAAAMGLDADAAWAYVKAQKAQQSQDEEVARLKQRLIDQGYDEATAQKMIREQLTETGWAYDETTGKVEEQTTSLEEAADWLSKYNDQWVMVGGTLIKVPRQMAEVTVASQDMGDEIPVTMDTIAKSTAVVHRAFKRLPQELRLSVVDMKSAIKDGKQGIVSQMQDLAWQSKHPFAETNYAEWLQKKQRQALTRMEQAAKKGKWGVVAQYRQLVDDIGVELVTLPGYVARIQRRVNTILTRIRTAVLRAVTYVFNLGDGLTGGVEVSDAPTGGGKRGKRGKNGHRASGGPVSAGGTYLVGERGPELLTMGGNGFVTPNKALGGRTTVNITINAGVGDPVAIGDSVIKALRAYTGRRGNGDLRVLVGR